MWKEGGRGGGGGGGRVLLENKGVRCSCLTQTVGSGIG